MEEQRRLIFTPQQLIYSTALLLVLVIMVLNLAAIRLRNQLREKFRGLESV